MTQAKYDNGDVDLAPFRHTVLNMIRSLNVKFRSDYGQLVIAMDGAKSWRHQIFPYYKHSRKAEKAKSPINWIQLANAVRQLGQEIKASFPYHVINVSDAEGDDVIGVLTRHNTANNVATIIISADTDFIQLQANTDLVRQWDQLHDKWVHHADPKRYMFEHVVKGDRGDGVPSALQPDDYYISKPARKPISQAMLDRWWTTGELSELTFLQRNIRLIDLAKTPESVANQIFAQMQDAPASKANVWPYMVEHSLVNLSKHLGEF